MVRKYRAAFTLVELLVVFSIIVILSGVLLPAVQSSREAARLTSCRSNVSQLAKGMVQYETFHSAFPSGGWSPQWLGMAERPNDSSQPGGWAFGVLPYIEEMSVRNIVVNVPAGGATAAYAKLVTAPLPMFSCPSRRGSQTLALSSTSFQGGAVTLSKATRSDFAMNSGTVGSCPDLALYAPAAAAAANKSKSVSICQGGSSKGSTVKVTIAGLGREIDRDDDDDDDHESDDDREGCQDDDSSSSWSLSSFLSWAWGKSSSNSCDRSDDGDDHEGKDDDRDDDRDGDRDDDDDERSTVTRLGSCDSCAQPVEAMMSHPKNIAEGDSWRKMSIADKLTKLPDMGVPDVQNGMSGRMCRLQAASVRDGLSNTYLIGEKCVAADTYYRGTDKGDCGSMMAGYSSDTARWGMTPPARDAKGVSNPQAFGSGHPGGWNVVYADGMVRTVSFDIDTTLHGQLSCRNDGKGMPPQ